MLLGLGFNPCHPRVSELAESSLPRNRNPKSQRYVRGIVRVVEIYEPNSLAPVHPGNIPYPHKPSPNRALMQSGTPEPTGLPWIYGRWMRSEDWEWANNVAGGIPQ